MQVVYFAQVESAVAVVNPARQRSAGVQTGGPYFAGPIKIGITSNVYERMLGLSSTTRQKAWFLGGFVGTKWDERAMHGMFAHLRIAHFGKSGTEWFRPADELTNFITSLPASDLASPYGGWRRMPRVTRIHASRGSQLLTAAVEVAGRMWPDREAERARVALRLSDASGLWVTSRGVWALMNGYVMPCPRLRAAMGTELGIPIARWSERPDPTALHPVHAQRLRAAAPPNLSLTG